MNVAVRSARVAGIGVLGTLMSRPFATDGSIVVDDDTDIGDPTRLFRDFSSPPESGGESVTDGTGVRDENCDTLRGKRCSRDSDCEACRSVRSYRCIFNSDRTRGVCGATMGRAFDPCSSVFGVQDPVVMHGAVLWKCTSKFPHLVNNEGNPVCCRGGRFVNRADDVLYVAGFHDPRQCECRDCPRGTLSDGVNCVRDPCYPGHTRIDTGGDRSCRCPPGYVSCPGEAFRSDDANVRNWYCPRAHADNITVCVLDPCKPQGRYDHALKRCVPTFSDTWTTPEGVRNAKNWQALFRWDPVAARLGPPRGFMGTGQLCDRKRLVPSRDPAIDYEQWWSKWLPYSSPAGIDELTRYAAAVRSKIPEGGFYSM